MVIFTPSYVIATAVTVLLPLVAANYISPQLGLALTIIFFLGSCFGRTVGRQSQAKWKAAASLWPSMLPPPLKLERGMLVNRDGLHLRRFTIKAERPKAACILVHGYAQSAHFEFLAANYPGGPHSTWDDSILQHLADSGISCYAMDLQGHGESEGARGLRGFFEKFDDLAVDLLQLHDLVSKETNGELPIFWCGTSMGGAVCCRAAQMRPMTPAGLVMLAPMVSLAKVAEKSVAGPIKNKHLAPIGGLLAWLMPTLPLIKKSESVLAQQLDAEFRSDNTNYTGSVRVRVAYHFDRVCRGFLRPEGTKLALERVAAPAMLALHANADTMTEPAGSSELFLRASCERKTLVLISGPDGQPGACRTMSNGVLTEGLGMKTACEPGKSGKQCTGICQSAALKPGGHAMTALEALHGLNMWHSITTEPGCQKVSIAVAEWISEEAARLGVVDPPKRPPKSPVRRASGV